MDKSILLSHLAEVYEYENTPVDVIRFIESLQKKIEEGEFDKLNE